MSEMPQSAESANKPLVDLPVTREHTPKGIAVHADGSSTDVHSGYDVLRAGQIPAAFGPKES